MRLQVQEILPLVLQEKNVIPKYFSAQDKSEGKVKESSSQPHPHSCLFDLSQVDPDAVACCRRLQEAGYKAYIVGGGVRDILLNLHPKDFDIVTSAHPNEIKQLFGRSCLLIGKRFRLAHIRTNGKVFEVSTFRAGDIDSEHLIVRDNQFGTEEEDVLRRDFTINALFYDPIAKVVIDYVDGLQDIQNKVLRTIGDPIARFRQDPVRMLRLLKFQARLEFTPHEKTHKALNLCRDEIFKSAPARVLEEIFKMLESKKAAPFFELLIQHNFLTMLFPCFAHFYTDKATEATAKEFIKALDALQSKYKRVLDRTTLFSALIFPILEQEVATLTYDRMKPPAFSEIIHLSDALLHAVNTTSFSHIPKKLLAACQSALIHQFKLTPIHAEPRWNSRFPTHDDLYIAIELLQVRSYIHPGLKPVTRHWIEEFKRRTS